MRPWSEARTSHPVSLAAATPSRVEPFIQLSIQRSRSRPSMDVSLGGERLGKPHLYPHIFGLRAHGPLDWQGRRDAGFTSAAGTHRAHDTKVKAHLCLNPTHPRTSLR